MASSSLDVPLELIKDPRTWTVDDISLWLQWLGIGEHLDAFAARGVDGQALLQLGQEAAWADFGVVDAAQQRVLDSAVEPLRCFREESTESGLALHAIEGPVAGEVFFVGAGGITGGRHSASNGVVLSENYVSRRHFQITRDRLPQFFLQDVGSTTGTFLMVREGLQLDHLVVLQLGTTEVTVYIEDCQCTLVATEGPDKDARAVVPPQGLFVGREASNGFCVRDPQVSAFHAEVRYVPDQGFVLDDKYSTNRTWLRLSPDGQASRRHPLRVGDLFKVGSTLFHVIDPTSAPDADSAFGRPGVPQDRRPVAVPSHAAARLVSRGDTGVLATSDEDHLRPTVVATTPAPDGGRASFRVTPPASEEELLSPDSDLALSQPSAVLDTTGPLRPSMLSADDASSQPAPPALRWEPFVEGEARPAVPPDEYARRVTASRRRMHTVGSAWHGTSGDGARESDMRERELSSMQQNMRNSRAQTAYSLQQQRQPERRDEDLCKICYDRDIDVVLYPCGHFVLCRWCAQKVSDCPVCRLVITDVIRTYKA